MFFGGTRCTYVHTNEPIFGAYSAKKDACIYEVLYFIDPAFQHLHMCACRAYVKSAGNRYCEDHNFAQ